MDKLNSPNWRQELKASQRKEGKVTSNRWIQIATVNENNEPRLRTVVFRGWITDNSMLIFTDRRSEKFKEIKKNNNVEILWLLTKSKSQFRFKGNANIVQNDSNYWDKLNNQSKSTWFWPNPGNQFDHSDFEKDVNKEVKPYNFLVFEIKIHTVELLRLEKPIHKRYIWEESSNWIPQRINP